MIGAMTGMTGTLTCSNGQIVLITVASDGQHLVVAESFYTATTPSADVQQAAGIVASIVVTNTGSSGGSGPGSGGTTV